MAFRQNQPEDRQGGKTTVEDGGWASSEFTLGLFARKRGIVCV